MRSDDIVLIVGAENIDGHDETHRNFHGSSLMLNMVANMVFLKNLNPRWFFKRAALDRCRICLARKKVICIIATFPWLTITSERQLYFPIRDFQVTQLHRPQFSVSVAIATH